MIADAEKYKKEDETQHERISAKNSLESYCFNIKTKLTDKINARDKKKMIDGIEETIEWLEINEVKAILFLSLFYLFSFSLL
jgi:L1 cell adhesion molecule like protein